MLCGHKLGVLRVSQGTSRTRMFVFENRVLRRISGPKRDEVTGEWRKLHNGELNDISFSSPNIVWVIKSRIMRRAGM
jgi:hypothetical protein